MQLILTMAMIATAWWALWFWFLIARWLYRNGRDACQRANRLRIAAMMAYRGE